MSAAASRGGEAGPTYPLSDQPPASQPVQLLPDRKPRGGGGEPARGLPEAAAEVVHDLRNVLAAVAHEAELLRGATTETDARRRLEAILRATESGERILQRLRQEAGPRPEEGPAVLDLNRILLDVAEITRFHWGRVAGDSRPNIIVQLGLGEVPKVRGLASELSQVFTNLVVNASEALRQGGTIRLGTRFDGAHTVATVSDDGPGMSEETRARIFDRTFSTKGGDNSGLGLSIVADIVARHQGHIMVESAPGQGTTFYVMLHAAAEAQPSLGSARKLPPCRLLLVEDDAAVREGISRMLEAAGSEVRVAGSGREAITALSEGFDALLTDFTLGDMTGAEVARVARHRYPQIRVILITGWDSVHVEADGYADLVLTKPVRQRELVEALTTLLT
jgi:two-component system, cell cycle sensor histidine kinase and response regulator CckA